MHAPLPKTWWVEPGRLLAGRYPGDADDHDMTENMHRLLEAGVRCFINLQQPNERSSLGYFKPYEAPARQCALRMDVQIDFHHFPIRDMGATDTATMTAILNVIRESVAQDRCVYVHCWGGHGRTGMVVGCWLREQGLSGDETLKRIQDLRRHDAILRGWDSPQTREQVDVVLGWPPGNGNLA